MVITLPLFRYGTIKKILPLNLSVFIIDHKSKVLIMNSRRYTLLRTHPIPRHPDARSYYYVFTQRSVHPKTISPPLTTRVLGFHSVCDAKLLKQLNIWISLWFICVLNVVPQLPCLFGFKNSYLGLDKFDFKFILGCRIRKPITDFRRFCTCFKVQFSSYFVIWLF